MCYNKFLSREEKELAFQLNFRRSCNCTDCIEGQDHLNRYREAVANQVTPPDLAIAALCKHITRHTF